MTNGMPSFKWKKMVPVEDNDNFFMQDDFNTHLEERHVNYILNPKTKKRNCKRIIPRTTTNRKISLSITA